MHRYELHILNVLGDAPSTWRRPGEVTRLLAQEFSRLGLPAPIFPASGGETTRVYLALYRLLDRRLLDRRMIDRRPADDPANATRPRRPHMEYRIAQEATP